MVNSAPFWEEETDSFHAGLMDRKGRLEDCEGLVAGAGRDSGYQEATVLMERCKMTRKLEG